MTTTVGGWRIGVRPDADGLPRRYAQLGGTWVEVVSRKDFLAERWAYNPGEHVIVIGPTQIAGKTRLLLDLLGATDTTELHVPPVLLVTKPRDPVVTSARTRLGYRPIDRWPPPLRRFRHPPPGYMFWPKHMRELRAADNNMQIADQFERVINELFYAGDSITVADELYAWFAILKLQDVINRHLTQGGGMGSGLWCGTQRPSGTQQGALSGFVFNSGTHSFVARDPDRSNRRRLSEIGGVDPDVIEAATLVMPRYHFLYIHRDGPTYCVVGAS